MSFFVAEISSNHSCNLDRCLEFIRTAAAIGCDGVKFQLFKIEELFAKEVLQKRADILARKKWELPQDFLPHLAACSKENKLQFSCTPFYLRAVEELKPYVDFYKIASYELLWTDLLSECARTGKPVVLSCGMATLDEIDKAIAVLRSSGCRDITLLHCNSSYPTPVKDCNLASIEKLRQSFDCKVGWSDHTRNPAVIYRAVHHWNASMVEFHLDLDGKGEEYHFGHCWLPKEMKPVITSIRTSLQADGCGEKGPSESEKTERQWRADPSDGLRPLLHTRHEL